MTDSDIPRTTDVAVIGAGPGGYVAAIRAAQFDLDTVLVEREDLGGVCLNHGCIPSKAYVDVADRVHEIGTMENRGVYADPYVDFGEVRDWKDEVVGTLTAGVEQICRARGVTVVQGTATFEDQSTLTIRRSGDRPATELDFERAVISTGSRPIELPGFDFDDEHVLSSRDALALSTVPDKLVVVGAGYVGVELSTVFAKLGTKVHVVEVFDEVLPRYGEALTRPVRERCESLGVEFHLDARATGWDPTADGVSVRLDGADSTPVGDHVLVAVGREPVVESVDLSTAGVALTDEGFVDTDEQAQTTVETIYAVGDVAGEPMLAHKASREGVVAAERIVGGDATVDYDAVPTAVFTDPEIATVGLDPDVARERGVDVAVGTMAFDGNGRALTEDNPEGFVRVVADAESERVLGAQIVGEGAAELISEFAVVLDNDLTVSDAAATIHPHPTRSEAVMEAFADATDEAIHTL